MSASSSKQQLRTWTRFEEEADINSEMAYLEFSFIGHVTMGVASWRHI